MTTTSGSPEDTAESYRLDVTRRQLCGYHPLLSSTGRDLEHAAVTLAQGGVVAFPTETVYGLGASARQPAAVRRVFEIKERPADRALIVHVAGSAAIDVWAASAPEWARRLAETSWPGPLTLVLARASTLPSVVTGGGDTVGLRAPDHPSALALIAALAAREGAHAGIAAPSANPHGAIPPTTAAAVVAGLGDRVDYVLDGGECSLGIESTVVDATGQTPLILREGAIARERIAALTGLPVREAARSVDPAPELAAGVQVLPFDRAEDIKVEPGDAVIVFRPALEPEWEPPAGCPVAGAADLEAYGRMLYGALGRFESGGCRRVFVQRVPDEGLGRAINARIARAASRRGQ
jgi:L-threonylcarbamoyladenylate synthase